MGLPTNNKSNKAGGKNQKANNQGGSKFISKPGKVAGAIVKKATRTGGTRGS